MDADTDKPPQDLRDVLDAPRRDAREVHLDHRLLDRGLPAPVALDDRRGEPHPLELGLRIAASPEVVANLRL